VFALLGALVAGALTTLAPCVLPLLPVIVGGTAAAAPTTRPPTRHTGGVGVLGHPGLRRALVITGALGASITVFTLVLKASTALIAVPTQVWSWVSGGILIALGLVGAFPDLWERVSMTLGLQGRSDARLRAARSRGGVTGDVLTGAALGPVFSSCSPLYGYVVVTVLPASVGYGLALLAAYVLGLCATLLAIALAGRRLVQRLGWAADTHGRFRRVLGVVFIVVGLAVALGWDRLAQAWILEHSPITPWQVDSGFIPS
jgi:cytochrome c biogenesis protein CcdA